LTDEAVREIRASYALGATSHRKLAREWSVSVRTVRAILLGKAYSRVV
jgi:hypothetical protein